MSLHRRTVVAALGILLTVLLSILSVADAQPTTVHEDYAARSGPTLQLFLLHAVTLAGVVMCPCCQRQSTCRRRPYLLSITRASLDDNSSQTSMESGGLSDSDDGQQTQLQQPASLTMVSSSPSSSPSCRYDYIVIPNLLQYAVASYPKAYRTLRKSGLSLFMGQLPTCAATFSRIPTALLHLLFPNLQLGVDVDCEYQTSRVQPGRGTGCANVWTRDKNIFETLLWVSKQVLVDLSDACGDVQLVMTLEVLHRFPHLVGVGVQVWSQIPSLTDIAQRRGARLKQHFGWSPLGQGPVNVEPSKKQPRSAAAGVLAIQTKQEEVEISSPLRSEVKSAAVGPRWHHNPYQAVVLPATIPKQEEEEEEGVSSVVPCSSVCEVANGLRYNPYQAVVVVS